MQLINNAPLLLYTYKHWQSYKKQVNEAYYSTMKHYESIPVIGLEDNKAEPLHT